MTEITEDRIAGLRRISLSNGVVRAQFLPELGGKMTSLVRLASGHEFLLQPQRRLRLASYGAAFDAFDTSGFDECVPTVAACRYPGGEQLPDHGELWSVPWQAESSGDELSLSARGKALPYRFTKRLWLDGGAVVVDYEIVNESGEEMHYLWSAHPLLTAEPGSRIVLPKSVSELLIEYSFRNRLGARGETCAWPVAQSHQGEQRLDVLLPRSAGFADKLFTPPLKEGYCALQKPGAREAISFSFDPAEAPYLGLWICQGGWPDSSHGHYTVALEPCTGRPDSLAEAIARHESNALPGGHSKRWTLRICVSSMEE